MDNNIKKIQITLLIFALIAISLAVFLIYPLFNQIKTDSYNIISAKDKIATIEVQAQEINKFKNNYQAYKVKLDEFSQLFINPSEPIDFIKFLENTAVQSGVSSKISLQTSSLTDFAVFQDAVSGTFTQVMYFIKRIETGPYLVELQNLSVQNLVDDKKNVNAIITIKVFAK